jgi:chaperonin GroES
VVHRSVRVLIKEMAMVAVQGEVLVPRNEMVLVRMDREETVTKGGILLVKGTRLSTGTVVAVGPGAATDAVPGYRMPMDLKVGERVYVAGNQFACEVEDAQDRYILIQEKSILASVRDDEAAP